MAKQSTRYDELLKLFRGREEGARLSNLSRKEQIESIYGDIIKRYEPGGGFGAGYESMLGRQKVRDVGASSQRDISRGLYGIRPYEQEWEATTGAAGRLKLEDIRMERLSGAQTGMAGFLERIEEPYPDYGSLLVASQAQGQGGGGGGRRIGSIGGGGDYMSKLFGANRYGGGNGGPSYTAGQSPTQLALAQRNKAARAEQEKRAAAASGPQGAPVNYATFTDAAGGGSGGVQIGQGDTGSGGVQIGQGDTGSGGVQIGQGDTGSGGVASSPIPQKAPFSLKNSTWASYQAYAKESGGIIGSRRNYEAAKRVAK